MLCLSGCLLDLGYRHPVGFELLLIEIEPVSTPDPVACIVELLASEVVIGQKERFGQVLVSLRFKTAVGAGREGADFALTASKTTRHRHH